MKRTSVDKAIANAKRASKRASNSWAKTITKKMNAKPNTNQLAKQAAFVVQANAKVAKLQGQKKASEERIALQVARKQQRHDEAIDKVRQKLAGIVEFEQQGGRYSPTVRAKITRLNTLLNNNPQDIKYVRERLSDVSKMAGKERRVVERQHKLIQTRINEAEEIVSAGGQLAPEYAKRLAEIKEMHETDKNRQFSDTIMNYVRNQRKGQVLRAKGASIGQVKITAAISSTGAVNIYDPDTDSFHEPQYGGPLETVNKNARMDMENGLFIPIRYKQSERQAVASFIKDKLMEIKKKQDAGEEVLTGKVLDNALILLNNYGVLEYDLNKGLKSLKFNPKKIDEIAENGPIPAENIDEILYSLAGYERFSEEATNAVEEQRLFNTYKIRGKNFRKYSHTIIDQMLHNSSIWNHFHSSIYTANPKSSQQEQDEMDEYMDKARAIEDYFPPSFIEYTMRVMEVNEVRGHTPLTEKWVEVMIFIYNHTDMVDNETITMEDLDEAVKKLI